MMNLHDKQSASKAKVGVSILEVMVDLVKVGQTMGYKYGMMF
jgi:hypothetical protein